MSKKKRFGISEALTRGLSETIHVVENNLGLYRNVVLPLSRIELDPDNPRQLAISLLDVIHGVNVEDEAYARKQEELERLKELAHTIEASGVINPIVVYKRGETYRVVAGERRCLASILAGKQEIDARVFNEKPRSLDLKLIQWVENTAREDLTLDERLGNIRDILSAYQGEHKEADVNATLLKKLTGLSLPQCTYYLAVLKAPEDVRLPIAQGEIRNLDKAALLSGIASSAVRKVAITSCINGASLKELRTLVKRQKEVDQDHSVQRFTKAIHRVNLGSTANTLVVKFLIDGLLKQKLFQKYQHLFINLNWSNIQDVSHVFKRFIQFLETEVEDNAHGK